MNLPAAIFTVRWLIRDTFRQARASGIQWMMLGLSTLCIVFCLSVDTINLSDADREEIYLTWEAAAQEARAEAGSKTPLPKEAVDYWIEKNHVTIVNKTDQKVTFLFGLIQAPASRNRQHEIRYVQFYLLNWIAGTAGVLLALIWTGGFVPSFLQPGAASVLLAKPVPRWSLLVGKYFGVVVFFAAQMAIFVFGTWIALGLATGFWGPDYLLCLPVIIIHFGVFFSFSVLLAVSTRSTSSCVFGSLLFWVICSGMNGGRHLMVLLPEAKALSPVFEGIAELGYWALPKPVDFSMMLLSALDVPTSALAFDIDKLREQNAWDPDLSMFSSCVFAGVMLALAARDFVKADY